MASASLYKVVASWRDYRFAAKSGSVTISGSIINKDGQTIAEYQTTLPFASADNPGYKASQVDMATVITSALTAEQIRTGVAGFTVPTSLLSSILAHTGAQQGVDITTKTLTLDNITTLGDVQ